MSVRSTRDGPIDQSLLAELKNVYAEPEFRVEAEGEYEALRAANTKFERRFRGMEALAEARSQVFAALPLDQQERLWVAIKASEK